MGFGPFTKLNVFPIACLCGRISDLRHGLWATLEGEKKPHNKALMEMGCDTKAKRDSLLRRLSMHYNLPKVIIENLLCEVFRTRSSLSELYFEEVHHYRFQWTMNQNGDFITVWLETRENLSSDWKGV